jgi:NAD(P)-dependent dehydrogenase (short-subunit alcohol dehydrogenase family)
MSIDNGWRDLVFTGRTAVVTGAAQGIGRAVTYRLAGLGARTMIWDLDGKRAEQTAAELRHLLEEQQRPHRIEWSVVDVTDAPAVEKGMSNLAGGSGIDVLVNNAGTTSVQTAETMALDVWERTLLINLTGTFHCCMSAIPHLRQRPGAAIVNIWSSSAVVGGGGGAHYAASKAGVYGLTRHLARELARRPGGHCIAPAPEHRPTRAEADRPAVSGWVRVNGRMAGRRSAEASPVWCPGTVRSRAGTAGTGRSPGSARSR